MKFKKNFHKSKRLKIEKVEKMIIDYPKEYSTPKYLTFCKEMLECGWNIKLYIAGVSKYIFVYREDVLHKVRFSNHRPIYSKENKEDCDFYVGVSHKQVSTTEQITQYIKNGRKVYII